MKHRRSFVAEKEGYAMHVELNGGHPYWVIIKDKTIIDECYHHPPTKCELSARVQAERVLNKILNTNNVNS